MYQLKRKKPCGNTASLILLASNPTNRNILPQPQHLCKQLNFLQQFAKETAALRSAQKGYCKERTPVSLARMQQAERKIDSLLHEYDRLLAGQLDLFYEEG